MYHPHDLRRTTATLLLVHTDSVPKVNAQLGHKHGTTTERYCAAANVLWTDEAVAAFAARFVTDRELFA